jgi:hypothetical protein
MSWLRLSLDLDRNKKVAGSNPLQKFLSFSPGKNENYAPGALIKATARALGFFILY